MLPGSEGLAPAPDPNCPGPVGVGVGPLSRAALEKAEPREKYSQSEHDDSEAKGCLELRVFCPVRGPAPYRGWDGLADPNNDTDRTAPWMRLRAQDAGGGFQQCFIKGSTVVAKAVGGHGLAVAKRLVGRCGRPAAVETEEIEKAFPAACRLGGYSRAQQLVAVRICKGILAQCAPLFSERCTWCLEKCFQPAAHEVSSQRGVGLGPASAGG